MWISTRILNGFARAVKCVRGATKSPPDFHFESTSKSTFEIEPEIHVEIFEIHFEIHVEIHFDIHFEIHSKSISKFTPSQVDLDGNMLWADN